jgi:hypothetical protein
MLFSITLIQRISSLLLTPCFADEIGFLAFMCADCAAAAANGNINPLSVKGGTDYGSLERIQPPLQKLSLIEQCIVRRSRYNCSRMSRLSFSHRCYMCYRYTVKCSATSDDSVKLTGHVVLMQQTAPDDFPDSLQPVLDAAREGITIVFGGQPSLLARAHTAGRLATILEIRKHVILRWLRVLNEVNPEFSCPRLVQELGAAADSDLNNLATQIIDSAIHAEPELMQRLDEMCDDVAAVRAVLPEDEPLLSEPSDGNSEFERVALVPRHPNPSEEAAEAQAQHAINQSVIRFESGLSLENEFSDQRGMLSRAFPWIFCLGGEKGVPRSTGPLNNAVCRHLLLQHTCAAAHDHDLVFLLQDQKRRHAACRGATAAVASGHLEAFKALVEDAQFRVLLNAARIEGGQAAAAEVGRRVRPYLSIAGALVPNGPVERAKAVSKIYSMCYEYGLPSIYLAVSPDTSHTPAAIRMSVPEGCTPFDVDALAEAHIRGSIFEPAGWTSINLSSPSLQKLCSRNPVAAAETFNNRLNAVLEELLKCPSARALKKTPARWRLCGVFGTPYGFYAVVEAQGRGALHYHLIFWGSYLPHVLALAATNPEFKTRLEQALKTQTVAELPRSLHVDRLRARGLRAKGLADSATPPIHLARVPLNEDQVDNASILQRAQQCASQQCIHKHTITCHKAPAGECWCRMCKPEGYQQSDVAVFMHVTAVEGAGVSANRTVPDADISCTCNRNVDTHPIEAIDNRLIFIEHPRNRDDGALQDHETSGLPSDTVQWMKARANSSSLVSCIYFLLLIPIAGGPATSERFGVRLQRPNNGVRASEPGMCTAQLHLRC